jgi:putative protease
MAETLVGTVTHYFGKPQVGIVSLTAKLSIGDTLHFRGHGADFQQTVTSMQVEHAPVETASSGTEVGIRVDQRVKPGTEVYRVSA